MTQPNPNIPIKKSNKQISFYKDVCLTWGEILFIVKARLGNGWYKNGRELREDYEIKCQNTFYNMDISFPFAQQKGSLGEQFGSSVCISIDDCVAHGRHEGDFIEGDIVSVDFGLSLKEDSDSLPLILDAAWTKTYAKEDEAWIASPLKALKEVIHSSAKTTLDLSKLIEETAVKEQVDIVTALTGHGIGTSLHEAPYIYNAKGNFSSVPLFDNLCFCVEPIFVKKEEPTKPIEISKIYIEDDNWSVCTVSEQPGTHFETMFMYKDGQIIDLVGITNW